LSLAAPPDAPVLFIDRCAWSRALGQALQAASVPFVPHFELFQPDAPDEEWLHGIAQKGWPVITRDRRIRYKVNEQAAVVRARLHLFAFTQGSLSAAETGQLLVSAYPEIAKCVQRDEPPAFYSLQRSSKVARLKLDQERG
jgi:hypothetical protein